jgi:putative peptide zinc metalloprotease protein
MVDTKTNAGGGEGRMKRALRRLRFDLKVSRQRHDGEWVAVVGDPASIQYVSVPWRDYEMACRFDGRRGAREVADEVLREVPEMRVMVDAQGLAEHLLDVEIQLRGLGLCNDDGSVAGERFEVRERKRREAGVLARAMGVLFFRRSLMDPDRIFRWLASRLRWVFTSGFQIAYLLFLMVTAAMLLSHYREIQVGNLVAGVGGHLWISLGIFLLLKVLHEIGHGVACRHFGAEVHELGVFLFMFSPLFYVNVTDGWLIPQRWKRVVIAAAGMYVELGAAALCMWMWLFLKPGSVRDFAASAVIISGVGTVLTNLNPLMRFDGYYILSDALSMPNLRTRASAYIQGMVIRLFFGRDAVPVTLAQDATGVRARVFVAYAGLSTGYLLLVMWGILGNVDQFFDGLGLRYLSHGLAALWLVSAVGMPMVRTVRLGLQGSEGMSRVSRMRPLLVMGLVVVGVGGVMLLPRQREVERACVVQPSDFQVVRALEGGFLREVRVREGEEVAAGQVLAVMENPDTVRALSELRIQRDRVRGEIRRMQTESPGVRYLALQSEMAALGAQEDAVVKRLDGLVLRAGIAGRVGARRLEWRVGHHLKAGEIFTAIVPVESRTFLVPLDEREARFVREGARAQFRVQVMSDRVFSGVIKQEPLKPVGGQLHPALSAVRGGDVLTTEGLVDDSSRKAVPLDRQYYAVLETDDAAPLLRAGMTGRVRIDCGRATVGALLRQRVLDFVNLDYQL